MTIRRVSRPGMTAGHTFCPRGATSMPLRPAELITCLQSATPGELAAVLDLLTLHHDAKGVRSAERVRRFEAPALRPYPHGPEHPDPSDDLYDPLDEV